MHLNWFDFAIITLVLISILISFFRGFLREMISLMTWVAGIIVALRFSTLLATQFESMISSPTLRYVIAFTAIFLGVFILGVLINMLLKRLLKATGFSVTDRALGVAFGATRGILLVSIVLMFVTMTSFKKTDAMIDSQLSPKFMPLVTWLDGFLPKHVQGVSQWMVDHHITSKNQNYINTQTKGD